MQQVQLKSHLFTQSEIADIESNYDVTYMLDTQVIGSDGRLKELAAAFFYQKNPDKDANHSHYLGVAHGDEAGQIILFDGKPTIDSLSINPINGAFNGNGDFIYSVTRHDFVTVDDSLMLDGGREYLRIIGNIEDAQSRLKRLSVIEDKVFCSDIH